MFLFKRSVLLFDLILTQIGSLGSWKDWKRTILIAWEPGNTGKRCILITWELRNTRNTRHFDDLGTWKYRCTLGVWTYTLGVWSYISVRWVPNRFPAISLPQVSSAETGQDKYWPYGPYMLGIQPKSGPYGLYTLAALWDFFFCSGLNFLCQIW